MAEDDQPVVARRIVTEAFFETLSIPLVSGRGFTSADNRADAEPVTVISKGLAEVLWPGETAVGRSLGFYGGTFKVVGVAQDLRDENPISPTEMAFYLPMMRTGSAPSSFVVRARGDLTGLLPAIRDRVRAVDPDVPIVELRPLHDFAYRSLSAERFRTRLMTSFAVAATLLALAGVYGTVRRMVVRRRREIGIRRAVGAGPTAVLGLVLRRGAGLAASGVALGSGAALLLGRGLAGFLYGVPWWDPTTLAAVAATLVVAATWACLGPARGALAVDPVEVLRSE